MSRYILSIVIIAHNEDETIAKTILSVMKAASQARELLKSYEIILVDDYSDDRTVNIASRFPITILQHERQLGPSAARYTGHKNASPDAQFILFVDGDTTIYGNWLLLAIQYIIRRPNVAGVSGYIKLDNKHLTINPSNTLYGSPQQRLSGCLAMYRKEILDQVGSFDPWVLGTEEQELGFRIRQKNFELHRLNIIGADHHTKKNKTFLFHRLAFYQGTGQLIARELYKRKPLALELLKKCYHHFFIFGWVVLCILVALFNLLGLIHPLLWKAILIVSLLGYVYIAKKKAGLFKSALFIVTTFLESFYILVGFIKKHNNTTLPSTRLLKKGIQINIEHAGEIKQK